MYAILVIVISVTFTVIAWKLSSENEDNSEVVETVEFYPPEGYNSAETEFLYRGHSSNEGVISLLIHLANKGYLRIAEREKKGIFLKSKGFTIIRLKEYDGDNEYEKMFFKGLFGKKKNSVKDNALYDKFYKTLDQIMLKLEDKENKEKILEKGTVGIGECIATIAMAIIIFLLITIKPLLDEGGLSDSLTSGIVLWSGIIIFGTFGMILSKISKTAKALALIGGFGVGAIIWGLSILPSLMNNIMYLIMYIVGIICIGFLMSFIRITPKRTPYGNEMLGKIGGFKRFLETAEKEQLEALVDENPMYFYDILPYTYALGISDKWMKQFEAMALKAPDWYDDNGIFVAHDFNIFMTHTMKSANKLMSTRIPTGIMGDSSGGGSSGGGSSGGGFSGGGFSGGGSGGGGRTFVVN